MTARSWRHEEVGDAELFLEVPQEVDDLGLDGDIERRDRLVAHDQLRAKRDCPCDPDPLSLPAGELDWVAVVVLRVQADPIHELLDRCLDAAGGTYALDLERGADDRANGVPGIQGVVGVLEDDLCLPANWHHGLRRQLQDVDPVDLDPAAGRLHESQDGARDGRLAGARLPHEAECLAGGDRQVDPVDGLDVADGSRQESP